MEAVTRREDALAFFDRPGFRCCKKRCGDENGCQQRCGDPGVLVRFHLGSVSLFDGERRLQLHRLLFRTRQLDDNDRVWIEKIERSGNAFTVTMHEAIWQGNYFKTFTWYEVTAVNLGKLPAGNYTVKWIVKPLVFKQLEKPREAQNNYQTNWPTDAKLGDGKVVELKTTFSVRTPK